LINPKISNQMSDDKSTIAVVIPCVSNVLTKIAACDQRGIGTFVQTLTASINKRFANIETEMLVCMHFAISFAQELRTRARTGSKIQITPVQGQVVAVGEDARVAEHDDRSGG